VHFVASFLEILSGSGNSDTNRDFSASGPGDWQEISVHGFSVELDAQARILISL
jgi:hypothetical protein